MRSFRVPHAVALAAALTLAILNRGPASIEAHAQFQTTPTTFSGQATVVSGTVLGLPVTLVDTGPVAVGGGTLEMNLLCYPNGPNCTLGLPDMTNGALGAELLSATVVAQGNRSDAAATVASVTLAVPNLPTISATFVQAEVGAQCAGGQASVHADATVADLVINGQTINVSGDVNQEIPLPGGVGVVIVNEQVGSVNADKGDLTVSALHIKIPGVADIAIAKAHADIQCGVKFCPADKDFVTGGGWEDSRENFAVAGGMRNGGGWGHLLFIDHATGLKVKGTGVTDYIITGPTSRRIVGTYDSNGGPGIYQADVDDQGEPGRNDVFTLTLNGVPAASGTLAGGNIQLHTCK